MPARVKGQMTRNFTIFCNLSRNQFTMIAPFYFVIESTEGTVLERKKELSTEVLIGIICGCVAFVLIVSIICFIVYRRQKKQIDEYKELYFLRTGSSDYKVCVPSCNTHKYRRATTQLRTSAKPLQSTFNKGSVISSYSQVSLFHRLIQTVAFLNNVTTFHMILTGNSPKRD